MLVNIVSFQINQVWIISTSFHQLWQGNTKICQSRFQPTGIYSYPTSQLRVPWESYKPNAAGVQSQRFNNHGIRNQGKPNGERVWVNPGGIEVQSWLPCNSVWWQPFLFPKRSSRLREIQHHPRVTGGLSKTPTPPPQIHTKKLGLIIRDSEPGRLSAGLRGLAGCLWLLPA